MLLDQTLDLQKGWQQIPLVSRGIDRVRQGLAVVKGLEEGGKLVLCRFGLMIVR